MKRVGIVGYRSWIARVLMDRIQGKADHQIVMIDKRDAASHDSRYLDALFIIPGKLVQTPEERDAEVQLVHDIAISHLTCKRQILLGSQAVYRDTPYGRHKFRVEDAFGGAGAIRRTHFDQADMQTIVIRPGAIFGPTQDVNSPMLIPSIAREGGELDLKTPNESTKFISVDDLADYLISLIDGPTPAWWHNRDVPGTFEMTPVQLIQLWKTFAGLSAASPGTDA